MVIVIVVCAVVGKVGLVQRDGVFVAVQWSVVVVRQVVSSCSDMVLV